jgi:hypothetical protein
LLSKETQTQPGEWIPKNNSGKISLKRSKNSKRSSRKRNYSSSNSDDSCPEKIRRISKNDTIRLKFKKLRRAKKSDKKSISAEVQVTHDDSERDQNLHRLLVKMSVNLYQSPQPFLRKPPSPFYEESPLKKIKDSEGYVPLKLLLSFVQEETIAEEITAINKKYAEMIIAGQENIENVRKMWENEITEIQLKWGQRCVDTAWKFRRNGEISHIMSYGFSKAKEEIKMAMKIRFRGVQKLIASLNSENLERKIHKVPALSWWPSNVRTEL